MSKEIVTQTEEEVKALTLSCAAHSREHKTQAVQRIRDNFPAEMQELDQWVCWRLELRKDEKTGRASTTKVPYSTTGDKAQSDNPTSWATFDAACNAYLRGNYHGVGFMFSEDDPYAGVDFDKCVADGVMEPQRLTWMRELGSYSEYSQSGTGAHIIVRGTLPPKGRKSSRLNIEMYDSVRFFVVTGDHIEGTPTAVNGRQDELLALHHEVFHQVRQDQGKPALATPLPLGEGIPQSDQELLDLMFNSRNGHKNQELWNGDTSSYNGDDSAADLALCNALAFWTGKDENRMDSLFRQSGLMREKWDRNARQGETYGQGTIRMAIESTSEVYSGKRWQEDDQGAINSEGRRRIVETAKRVAKAAVSADIDNDSDSESAEQPQKEGKKSDSKPTKVYRLAMEHCEIFTGTDGAVYASADVNGHTEIIKVRSMRFRQYLGNLFYQKNGAIAGKSACDEAIELLAFQGETTRETFMRVAGKDGYIYIDLGDEKWQAIRINAKGWEIVDKAPVAFRRTAKMRPLPIPVSSGADQSAALTELFKLINVADEDRLLVVAWLLSAMCPKGPYPILTLVAEAGSAKTTTAKALKRLISPYVAETRSRPKTVEDVYVAAQNDWVLIYDNLSSIPVDISDAFCRLSTGGGYATRELYADLDEVATDQQQPLIINGISDIIKKGDLMSRALVVTCPEITQEKRVAESDWDAKFEEARPRIMGALLDLLSAVLEELPNTRLDTLPRMADFAKLGATLDRVCGIVGNPMSFTARYSDSIAHGTMSVIEQSPVYRPLYKFMRHHGKEWTGTATALLEELRKHATDLERIDLPTLNTKLSNAISEIAPNLRLANIMDVRKSKSNGNRSITITMMRDFAKSAPEAVA